MTAPSLAEVLKVARQVPVFPCRVHEEWIELDGKRVRRGPKSPYTTDGFKAASQDPDQIEYWYRQYPDCLWGVPTGRTTRLIVLDYDPSKVTPATDEWIEAHTAVLMQARIHTTGRAGRHYLYRATNGAIYTCGTDVTLDGKKRPGLDIRGEGGYVIWWPLQGLHQEGTAPELPAELLKERAFHGISDKPTLPPSPAKWAKDQPLVAAALAYLDPENYEAWIKVGISLHFASEGGDSGFQLWHAWSAGEVNGTSPKTYGGIEVCRDKWDSFGKGHGAAKRTLGSLFLEAKGAGWIPRQASIEPPPIDPEDPGPIDPSAIERNREKNFGPRAPPLAAVTVTLEALMAMGLARPKDIMGGLIREGSLCLISAQRGVGKTFLGLGLAMSMAAPRSFLDFPVSEPLEVLYIDGEMSAYDMAERCRLLSIPMELDSAALQRLHIFTPDVSGIAPKIDSQDGRSFVAQFLKDHPATKAVFLDNVSCLTRPEANDTYGARSWLFINDLMLDCRRAGVAVIAFAHHGKDNDKGVRGASQAEDLLDVSIALTAGPESENETKVNFIIKKGRHLEAKDKQPFVACLGPAMADGLAWSRAGQVPLMDRIKIALRNGASPSEIATDLPCNRQYVYEVRAKMIESGEFEKEKKRGPAAYKKPYRDDDY